MQTAVRTKTSNQFVWIIVGALALVQLVVWLSPALHFSLASPYTVALHTTLEVAAIAISLMVFSVSWVALGKNQNTPLSVACVPFLAVAIVDLLHTLTYSGMPVLTPVYIYGQAITFFLLARGIVALSMLALAFPRAVAHVHGKVRPRTMLAISLLIAAFVASTNFAYPELYPAFLIPGVGLTLTKVALEYILILMNLAAAFGFLYFAPKKTDEARLLAAACVVMALSENYFTLYANTADQFIHLGHLYKVIAYFLLYRAIFVANIRLPFEELERRQEELLIIEKRFKGLIELSSAWYWEQDENFRFSKETAEEGMHLVRMDSSDLAGKARWEIPYINMDAEGWREHRRMLDRREVFKDFELLRYTEDGEFIAVSASGEPRFDDEGRFIGYRGISRDITERKRAELQLQESEQRLAGVIESAMDAIITTDTGGRILVFNKAAEAMFRCPASDAINAHIDRFIPARYRDGHPQHMQRFSVGGTTSKGMGGVGIVHALRSDGSEFPVDASISHTKTAAGELLTVIMRDVTKTREMERAVMESEARYRSLFEISPVPTSVIANGKIVFCNKARLELAGATSPEQLINQPVFAFVHSDPMGKLKQAQADLLAKPGSVMRPIAIDYRRLDGSILNIEVSATSFIENGEVRLIVCQRDITEKNHLLDELAQSEERFRAVFEQSNAGIVIVSPDYKLIEVNQAMANFLKLPRQEFVGKRYDFAYAKPIGEEHSRLVNMQEKREREVRWERPFLRSDGQVVWSRSEISGVFDNTGKLSYYVSVLVDVTEEHNARQALIDLNSQLEKQVQERTAQLKASNQDLEAFSYSVAHDLRAPLRSINGFAQILEGELADKPIGEDAQQFLSRIRRSVDKMSALIDDLLSLAQVSQATLRIKELDMRTLVAELADEIRQDYPKTMIHIAEMPRCEGDPTYMRQVIENLLRNAFKYSSKAAFPLVEIGWDFESRAWFVRDNGAGFDPRYVDKLFAPFQRLHSDAEFAGTGIGLAIVKRIIDKHGGRIWAECQPGDGAVFRFRIGPS